MATCPFPCIYCTYGGGCVAEALPGFCVARSCAGGGSLPRSGKRSPLPRLTDSSAFSCHIQIQTADLSRNCASTFIYFLSRFVLNFVKTSRGLKKFKKGLKCAAELAPVMRRRAVRRGDSSEGKRGDFPLGDTVLSVGSICTALICTHYAD